jgi:hypothetical protein
MQDGVLESFFIIILVSEKSSIDCSRVADSKKKDGIGLIRTGDLRHVKTEDLAISAPFSDAESDGDITTRKAKTPSWMV